MLIFAVTVAALSPIVPKFLDIIKPLNEPRPVQHVSQTKINELYEDKFTELYTYYFLLIIAYTSQMHIIYCNIIISAVHFVSLTNIAE